MIVVAEAKDEEAVTLTVATYNLYNFPAQIHEEKAEKNALCPPQIPLCPKI